MTDILHIVFSHPDDLHEALKEAGRDERVIHLDDDLSFGPIDPPDPEARELWARNELGLPHLPHSEGDFPICGRGLSYEDVPLDNVADRIRTFWAMALAPRPRKILWVSRRSARDCCGYLEWLWRAGDLPCEIVDLTDIVLSARGSREVQRALDLSRMGPQDILEMKLLDRGKSLPSTSRQRDRRLWRRLRSENAPFRVIEGDQLVSAPITIFDTLLLSTARAHTRKVAMLVASAYLIQRESETTATHSMVLAARVKALVEAGRLQLDRGDPLRMHHCEVRLPPRGGFSVAPPDAGS